MTEAERKEAEANLDSFLHFFKAYQHEPSQPLPLWELERALSNEDHIGFGGMTRRSYLMVAVYAERLAENAMSDEQRERAGARRAKELNG